MIYIQPLANLKHEELVDRDSCSVHLRMLSFNSDLVGFFVFFFLVCDLVG